MRDYLIENFKMYYPLFYNKAVDFHESGFGELIVLLDDGISILYDDLEKTFRRVPSDYNNITEAECKREFGKRLYKMIKSRGLTQLELSEMTGIPNPMISNYISGKTSPSFYKVDKIAKALNCSIDELRYIW